MDHSTSWRLILSHPPRRLLPRRSPHKLWLPPHSPQSQWTPPRWPPSHPLLLLRAPQRPPHLTHLAWQGNLSPRDGSLYAPAAPHLLRRPPSHTASLSATDNVWMGRGSTILDLLDGSSTLPRFWARSLHYFKAAGLSQLQMTPGCVSQPNQDSNGVLY